MTRPFIVLAFVFLSMVVGCGGSDEGAQGELNGPCYPNDTCNAGLICESGT